MSRADTVASYFIARPNVWVSALTLMEIGGALSWRTRVNDCRKAPYFLDIENRTRTVRYDDGRRVLLSEYRNVVAEVTTSGSLFNIEQTGDVTA